MNGVNIKGCHVRLGFGKTYPSKCVWITGLNASGKNYNFLLTCLADCGNIINFSIDYINKRALVYYEEIANAEAAINKMKNGLINGLYLRGDYASIECQIKFAEFFKKQNNKKYLSIDLDNVDIQNTSISNVNKQKSAVSHYGEADNTCIASKEFTSEITCIWVNGIADSVSNEYLESHFSQFGPTHKCLIDRFNKCALLCFQEELHAQSAVTATNGSYIEGKPVNVRLASLRCQASDVSTRNNDNVTIQIKDNTAQTSPYSARHVDLSCKCTINDETYPINISDPHNNSINVNNAQYTSQQKYLNTYNIDIPKYSSKTIDIKNSSITIIFNEYPPERLEPPTQYADSDILSLPLPEFAKNISKERTSTSSRYSPSSSGNQDTHTFNVHHDEMINYGLGKTDNQNKKQDQNNNHPPKSNYKMLESAAELQNLFFEEVKRFQDFSNKHTPKEFIQSQSSPKFKNQQLSSLLGTLSTSGSSKYSLCPSESVFQSQYNSPSDTQPKIIPPNSKTPLLDSQILRSDPKLLIDPKCASAIDGTISDINGLFLTKKNKCTISNRMHTSDAINTDFVNPIPKVADRNKTLLEIGYKFGDEYPKDWVTPSNLLTNNPNYNCVEKLDHLCSSETSKKEKEGQKKLQSKPKSLDGFVAKNSIEFVVQPNFVDVEKSTNIDEEKIDNDICEKSNSKRFIIFENKLPKQDYT
ncbi:uncharacterized protein LOC115033011 [Acyrthosiphon pisum]|uniref:RRM domain-containing protein n=1 Tax=Acyrthosiphon pisum TaxID=7029 RepID=A0A8R2NKB3_ACYPI|nr:uncharacterized protein LOC115033011 [Acyrthosiphon pisum]